MTRPGLRLVFAAVRTVAAYLLVSLYVLIVGPAGLALALLAGRPDVLYRLAVLGVRLGFWLTGIRFSVEGAEHVRPERPAIYAVNHTSNIEPPIVFLVLRSTFPRLQILYKAELRKLPILGRAFDVAGFVPIDRSNREQSDQAVARAVRQIEAGNSFVVFPEGTRSRTGELLPFKKGAFLIALRAQAPIVPMAILGARDAMRKGSPIIWPVTVDVKLGPAVETAGMSVDDRDRLIDTVRGAIAAMLDELAARRAAAQAGR
jgi:1-acyl-sn-glycerol-3-phosphate acyltransferase